MAEYQVNIAELQEICNYIINADYPYFEELREAFKLLRHTGCREMEIFEIQRWSQVSGDEFTLTPQKGNNNRTIILGSEFTDFKAAILGQYPPFLGRTYSQLQNLFKRVCPYWPIYSGGKQITLYTFRYLFLHELKADGLTNQQIADVMGHVNVETVSNYLDAILSSTNEVPVVPPLPNFPPEIPIYETPTYFDGIDDKLILPAQLNPFQCTITGNPVTNQTNTRYILFPIFSDSNSFYPYLSVRRQSSSIYFTLGLYSSNNTSFGSIYTGKIYNTNGRFFAVVDLLYTFENGVYIVTGEIKVNYRGYTPERKTFLNVPLLSNIPNQMVIGARHSQPNTFDSFFDGTMNDLKIYNRAFSDAEMY